MTITTFDTWTAGEGYEHYMGQWSRRIATRFIDWLSPAPDKDWIEIGCGTGALTAAILSRGKPRSVVATDQSAHFVAHSRAASEKDPRVRFVITDADALRFPDASADCVTSGLVLNFVPDRIRALREMRRVQRPGGTLSFYVWDYPGGGMGLIDAFWTAAIKVDPGAAAFDESRRFPFCTPDGLRRICDGAGLKNVQVAPIEATCAFDTFEIFWQAFTKGDGPAPGYCQNLSQASRADLKAELAQLVGTTGPITLPARAWAVKSV